MKAVFLFLYFFSPLSAWAILPTPVKSGIGLQSLAVRGTDDYRLGDEWGKRLVTSDNLRGARREFRRASLATARVGGATGFFLGKFRGELVMATNHHVLPYARACLGSSISFPLLGVQARCEKFLGTWSEIDLALFTVSLSNPADEAKLLEIAGNFQFREDVHPGQALLTIGFGVAGNSGRGLMANEDSDCYVFSPEGEYRLMADPDQWNPGSYRAWSFALGCDVSHGDSGSAIVDRNSGQVVGIIWTGRIPKSASVQNSQTLSDIFRSSDPSIWTELSYAVPAKKIGSYLESLLSTPIPEDSKLLLQAILQ